MDAHAIFALDKDHVIVTARIKMEDPECARIWEIQVPERPPVNYYLGQIKLPDEHPAGECLNLSRSKRLTRGIILVPLTVSCGV